MKADIAGHCRIRRALFCRSSESSLSVHQVFDDIPSLVGLQGRVINVFSKVKLGDGADAK